MEDSILLTVKKLIGGADPAYSHFDEDLILHTNMALAVLDQLISDSTKPFRITGSTETWSDIASEIGLSEYDLGLIKDYVCTRVRLQFDPPQSSFVMEAMKDVARELEFRILASFDPRKGS